MTKNAKLNATSDTGHFNKRGSETSEVTMFEVFAANPSKPTSFHFFALFNGLLLFLFSWIGFSVWLGGPMPGAFAALACAAGFVFLVNKKTSKDDREHAHDTRISVSALRVLRADDEGEAQVKVSDLRCFSMRSSLTGETAYVETHFQGSSVAGNGLFAGFVGEGLIGSRAMPGVAGGAIGGFAATATAATNVVGATLNGASNGLRRAHVLHRMRLAEHSYVVQAVTRDNKSVLLAGGLNRDSAFDLMHQVNEAVDHALVVSKQNQEFNNASLGMN